MIWVESVCQVFCHLRQPWRAAPFRSGHLRRWICNGDGAAGCRLTDTAPPPLAGFYCSSVSADAIRTAEIGRPALARLLWWHAAAVCGARIVAAGGGSCGGAGGARGFVSGRHAAPLEFPSLSAWLGPSFQMQGPPADELLWLVTRDIKLSPSPRWEMAHFIK